MLHCTKYIIIRLIDANEYMAYLKSFTLHFYANVILDKKQNTQGCPLLGQESLTRV